MKKLENTKHLESFLLKHQTDFVEGWLWGHTWRRLKDPLWSFLCYQFYRQVNVSLRAAQEALVSGTN